jgi:hypothetical protein
LTRELECKPFDSVLAPYKHVKCYPILPTKDVLFVDFYFDLLSVSFDLLKLKLVAVFVMFVQFVENEEAVVWKSFDFYKF